MRNALSNHLIREEMKSILWVVLGSVAFATVVLLVLGSAGSHARRASVGPDLSGHWYAQVQVWNDAAKRAQGLTRVLELRSDGTYRTTIRVTDAGGTATFPTLSGKWSWETIQGTEQFCVTPDVESQKFPHCYPLVVDADRQRFTWGDVVFLRAKPSVANGILDGQDEYPDPTEPVEPTTPTAPDSTPADRANDAWQAS